MARRLRRTAVLGLATICVSAVAIAQTTPPSTPGKNCIGKANKAKISAFVVLLRLRWDVYAKWKETGVWPADPETDKALEGHSQYWTTQLKEGRAVLAGAMGGDYWDNAALIIFEAGSLEQAETTVKNDPAVKAHAFQAQVRPFDMLWVTNKFTPNAEVCSEPANNSGHGEISAAEAEESAAVGSMRTLNSALVSYWGGRPERTFPLTLKQLGPEGEQIIEGTLASGIKNGYTFVYRPEPAPASGAVKHYTIVARPVKLSSGEKSFFTDDTGTIRVTTEDRPATAKDASIQ